MMSEKNKKQKVGYGYRKFKKIIKARIVHFDYETEPNCIVETFGTTNPRIISAIYPDAKTAPPENKIGYFYYFDCVWVIWRVFKIKDFLAVWPTG